MSDDRAFELALDEALLLLASGVSREECLRRFPLYAAELAPLLEAAEAARAGLFAGQPVPKPNLARGRRRFLDAARAQTGRPMWLLNVRWVSAALAMLLVIVIGAGVASANALPGEALYPVKRGLEAAQLALTFDPEARARLQDAQAERRRAEAQQVLELGRETRIEFEGIVEAVQLDALWISGLRVLTDTASEYQVADVVRVWAHTSPGALIADRIILLARPTPTAAATPTRAPTITVAATRPADTITPTPTEPRPSATRIPSTATATPTTLRPTEITPSDTRPAPTTTPRPTESRPADAPTSPHFTDTRAPEATATPQRPTPTSTASARP